MVNRLVDFIDCRLKPLGGKFVVFTEGGLECVEFILEIGDVNVLILDQGQFLFVLQRIHGRIAQQLNNGQEKLGTHHVHIGVAVEDTNAKVRVRAYIQVA